MSLSISDFSQKTAVFISDFSQKTAIFIPDFLQKTADFISDFSQKALYLSRNHNDKTCNYLTIARDFFVKLHFSFLFILPFRMKSVLLQLNQI